MSIKCSQFIGLTSNSKMFSVLKVFVFLLALVAVAFADCFMDHEASARPRVGLRIPFLPPSSPQVVGGEEAPEGSYPFIVSLDYYGQHFCAGSILDDRHILTAGHCVQAVSSANQIRVKAGKHNIKRTENTEQTVQVEKGFVHENYKGGVGPYDIALLKLSSPLKLNNRVQPIRLPSAGSEPTGEAWLCGWGSTSTTRVPKMPDNLQHVKMEYLDRQTCYEAVLRLTGSSPVHKTNICTGPLYDQISACSGDSGGPLISRNGQEAIQTGIVSWGIIPCGTAGAPSVYAKVSEFNDWIAQKINIY